MIEAILYILRVGCPWRDLPAAFGPWQSVYTRWRRWTACGLWDKLLRKLTREACGKLRFADATCCKVHAFGCGGRGGYAANAIGRTRGGNNTKVHALVDISGRVVRVLLGAGHRHDSQMAKALTEGMRCGQTLVADKAYDSTALRRHWEDRGIKVCAPARARRNITRATIASATRLKTSLNGSRSNCGWTAVSKSSPAPTWPSFNSLPSSTGSHNLF